MTINSTFIDQIVHSVMREMQTRTASDAPAALNEVSVNKTIRINNRVVSENVLSSANAAGRTISLLPGSVITPSGRDYIRRNGVRLTSEITGKSDAAVSGTFITVGANTSAAAASAAGWKTVNAATEFDAASLAAQHMTSGMVACCGGEPSVITCLLNRDPQVRSAVVTRTTNLVTLNTLMNPHVVCLESSGWSFAELMRLLRGLVAPSTGLSNWKELSGAKR